MKIWIMLSTRFDPDEVKKFAISHGLTLTESGYFVGLIAGSERQWLDDRRLEYGIDWRKLAS